MNSQILTDNGRKKMTVKRFRLIEVETIIRKKKFLKGIKELCWIKKMEDFRRTGNEFIMVAVFK